MAKKRVNKSQAVREYLHAHPQAMSGEIATTLAKQGIKITPGYVANIKSQLGRKRSSKTTGEKPAPVGETAMGSERPVKTGDHVSLDQVRAVAAATKALGGFSGLHRMLELVQDLGGPKRVKELVDAMSIASGEHS